ncbi:aromatic ring-hydroxylating dioxygenase subunit alpha [Sphingomonas sp. SRS2]|uniref:aromatic ring-hydroxylating dioxygenase subunit alpha n=1 Tax=Sphingomonas sp. SRS2 TaxID=133190 RepID=UPI0006184DED|nr:aromatic ring-hydroxylating dioxygenase subunit alpha [Sphingomonas sp. SRS2]KKC26642.1 hypothetical protein WP12_06730 [Sphingomonas sp. SRS2]
MSFLRNCWYMAAWKDEIQDKPLGRQIIGEHIVFFRRSTGDVVALSGRCSHRFAPLHLGKIIDDAIECPYHGLRYNGEGACVLNPQGNGATPRSVRQTVYPLIERYGGYWIWMGDPDRADPTLLPDYYFLEDPRFNYVSGYIHSASNYELMTDNILDLGHVDFLHAGTLGCEATVRAKTDVRQIGDRVECDRWMANEVQSPVINYIFRREGRVDAWLDVRWEPPGLMMLTVGVTDVGASREAGAAIENVHLMTPETEDSTHYFWANARDFQLNDEEFDRNLYESATAAFTLEDKPMIEAQQRMMGTNDLFSLKPALLPGDAAGVMARRTLAKLIKQESERDHAG